MGVPVMVSSISSSPSTDLMPRTSVSTLRLKVELYSSGPMADDGTSGCQVIFDKGVLASLICAAMYYPVFN